MRFEPTYDYGKTDLGIDENRILWKFGELVKTLITISSDAEKQKYMIGFGAVADEIALDFETYFTLSYHEYLENGLLGKDPLDELLRLDKLFDDYSGNKNPGFWDDSLLETNQDWREVRTIAKEILKLMGFDNLDIECKRHDIFDRDKLIGNQTITRLIEKF